MFSVLRVFQASYMNKRRFELDSQIGMIMQLFLMSQLSKLKIMQLKQYQEGRQYSIFLGFSQPLPIILQDIFLFCLQSLSIGHIYLHIQQHHQPMKNCISFFMHCLQNFPISFRVSFPQFIIYIYPFTMFSCLFLNQSPNSPITMFSLFQTAFSSSNSQPRVLANLCFSDPHSGPTVGTSDTSDISTSHFHYAMTFS